MSYYDTLINLTGGLYKSAAPSRAEMTGAVDERALAKVRKAEARKAERAAEIQAARAQQAMDRAESILQTRLMVHPTLQILALRLMQQMQSF